MFRSRRRALLTGLAVVGLLVVLIASAADRATSQDAPTVESAQIDGAVLRITLSEELSSGATADVADFSVKLGDETRSVSSATVEGAVVSLTLASAVPDVDCTEADVTVSYSAAASSLAGASGALAAFADQSVMNVTDQPPAIVSLETDATGRYIYVDFCEPITAFGGQWSDFSAFTVRRDGTVVVVNNLKRSPVTPTRLQLDLTNNKSKVAREGEVVTVSYDSSKAHEEDLFADADQHGLPVESWSALAVTNKVDSPPTLRSATALYDIVTLTFSEALDEQSVPEADQFTITGRTVTAIAISEDTVTLTLNGILAGGDTMYTLDYVQPSESPLRQLDGAHNVSDFFAYQFQSTTPTTLPVVQTASVNGATLTIEFDLPLKNVAPAGAFTVGGQDGVSVTAASFAGSVVTLTLSPAVTPGSTVTVTYDKPDDSPRVEARNNLNADSFSNRAVVNNTVAPAPELNGAVISADGATLTLAFSLALDSASAGTPAASTFSLSGTDAAVDSVSVDGTSVTLALSPPADVGETIPISYTPPASAAEPRLRSLAHSQPALAFSDQSATNNADGTPRPRSATIIGSQLVVGFDRALDAASIPAASAFTLSGAPGSVASVAISGSDLTLTLSSAVTHEHTVSLSYTAPTDSPLQRDGQAILVATFAALEVTNETPDPTPRSQSAEIDASGRVLTIVMSGPLLESAAGVPAASAFGVSGSTAAAVAGVAVAGSTVTLSLSPAADFGETITVSYSQPSEATTAALTSADGIWRTPSWGALAVTNRADGVPRPLTATVDGGTMTIAFDRALSESPLPPAGDFTMSPASVAVSTVSISGNTLTLTLSPAVAHDDTVTLSYSALGTPKLMRAAPMIAVSAFSGFAVVNQTPEPLIRSVIGDGDAIVITFSQALDGTGAPSGSSFSLGANGPTVDTVTVNTMSVGLDLAESLIEGAEYTLVYTPPSESPLRTMDSAVAAFSEPVTNRTDYAPALRSAVGDGAVVTLTFDQPLDGESAIPLTSFALGDNSTTVTDVAIANEALTLTLSRPLAEDEAITLSYTPPSTGGIVDPTGNRTAAFTRAIDNQTDTPPVPASGTVTLDMIEIILDQTISDDPRFDLDVQPEGYPTEHFKVKKVEEKDEDEEYPIDFVQVSTDGPGGVGKIVIRLEEPVSAEDDVTITYFPDTGTVRIREDDAGQNRAQINQYPLQNLTPAKAKSATVTDKNLVVTFDKELDSATRPPMAAFQLTSQAGSIESLAVEGKRVLLTLDVRVNEDDNAITLDYTPPETGALIDANGVNALGFTDLPVENHTDYAPYPTGAFTDADGTQITVTFDQRVVVPGTIHRSWFTTMPPYDIGPEVMLSDRKESPYNTTLTMAFDTPVREGVDVTLTYTAPGSNGLQDDDAGNPVETFTEIVDNNVDVAPQVERVTVNGNVLTIEFDQMLHPNHVPPASCEQLEEIDSEMIDSEMIDSEVDCETPEDFTWFTVKRIEPGSEPMETVAIETVSVDEDMVVLQLGERIGRTEMVGIEYQPKSYNDDSRNLRDTPEPPHPVEGFRFPSSEFPGREIENVTPATAEQSMLNRERPGELRVTFDSELDPDSVIDIGSFTVTADGAVIDIRSVSVDGTELIIDLAGEVPECATVVIEYEPGASPLLDSDQREIEAFRFEVENLINAERGLICVRSNFGGLVLTFNATWIPDRPGHEWRLAVNGEQREVEAVSTGSVVRLTTPESVCLGDSVEIRYSANDEGAPLVPTRTIDQAAPCPMSAVADGQVLSVSFDSPLDGAPADVADFEISGGATIARIAGVSGNVLTLRLAEPGILSGRTATLTYAGDSLQGGGLTVGPFELEVVNDSAPPEFVSGIAFGTFVSLTFDQPLIPRAVPGSRFLLLGSDEPPEVEEVSISGTTVSLILSADLPDEPDLLAVVYLAGSRGGLAGLTGARVPPGAFVVQNLTETPPSVNSAVTDTLTIRVGFDQPVNGDDALPSDFSLVAGHRTIQIESLEWSDEELELTLAERVTSLDAVRLTYAPETAGSVRDTSGLPLASFEIWADNETRRADMIAEHVDDARLRSSRGATLFERELAREYSSGHGIRAIAEGGIGRTTLVRGDMQLTLDASQLGDDAMRIELHPLTNARQMLRQLDSVPAVCWDQEGAGRMVAWLLDLSDVNGVPATGRLRVSIDGADAAYLLGGCVFDLIDGTWSFARRDGRVDGPALLIERRDGPVTIPIALPRAR